MTVLLAIGIGLGLVMLAWCVSVPILFAWFVSQIDGNEAEDDQG